MTPRLAQLFDLSGRVALVTGASSGIGRSLALALAEAGAAVVLTARREAELETAAQVLRERGGRAASIAWDLAERTGLADLARAASEPFGAPQILVNAAGINLRQHADAVTHAGWDRTMALHLDAPFFLAQALVPAMRTSGWGRVINIASLQSVRAFENGAAYGVAKGGVIQLTRAMAEAWSLRRDLQRDRARLLSHPADGAAFSRSGDDRASGGADHDRTQWPARGPSRNGRVPGIRGIRLHHGSNDFRRWRLDRAMTGDVP